MNRVRISMPLDLTTEMIRAVRDDPSTCLANNEEWHTRLGWLICAWEVLAKHRLPFDASEPNRIALPEEPTLAMLDAGWGICGGDGRASAEPNRSKIEQAKQKYRALLEAIPQPGPPF